MEAVEKLNRQCFDGIPCDVTFLVPRSNYQRERNRGIHMESNHRYHPSQPRRETNPPFQQDYRSSRNTHPNQMRIPNARTYQSSIDNQQNSSFIHPNMSNRTRRDSYLNNMSSRPIVNQHEGSHPRPHPRPRPIEPQPPVYQVPNHPIYQNPPSAYAFQPAPYMQQPPAPISYPIPSPARPQYSMSYQQPTSFVPPSNPIIEQQPYLMQSKPMPPRSFQTVIDTPSRPPAEMMMEPQYLSQPLPTTQQPSESAQEPLNQPFLETSDRGLLIENPSAQFNEKTVLDVFRTFGTIDRLQIVDSST